MIDYNDRRYDIGMLDRNGKLVLTRITHSETSASKLDGEISLVALEAALHTSGEYTKEKATIRDCFDTFLYYIERFERFLKLKLISEDEIFPYLRYYIRIFRGKLDHIDERMLEAFRLYLETFTLKTRRLSSTIDLLKIPLRRRSRRALSKLVELALSSVIYWNCASYPK